MSFATNESRSLGDNQHRSEVTVVIMKRFAALLVGAVVLLALSPVEAAAQGLVHVGDLDGNSASSPRNRWSATVTVTVHDEADGPVAGAMVTGSWSGVKGNKKTANLSGSCVTNASGLCTITLNNVKTKTAFVTFEVDAVAHPGDTYAPGANHDPDDDSNGTSITVTKP